MFGTEELFATCKDVILILVTQLTEEKLQERNDVI